MKIVNYKKTFVVMAFLLLILISLTVYLLSPFPVQDQVSRNYPMKFGISNLAKFEVQDHNQCSAFSTAFLLRTLGVKANGPDVYKKMSFKVPISGYVLPKGVITYIESFGKHPTIYRGNLNSLKSRLSLGEPVIVLVGSSYRWQHYMTLVGYDSSRKELYFFDSKKTSDTNGNLPGNRTLTEQYFLTMWDNGLPIFNHIYITIGG